MTSIYDFKVSDTNNQYIEMSEYRGKIILIVNVASYCGLTPQYKGLENLYKKYNSEGFEILAFPCNQFGKQEPGTNEEILEFCETNYSVSFKIFDKVNVNGSDASPLFKYLKQSSKGILGTESIKWNFTKFLVDKKGEIVQRFGPQEDAKTVEKVFKNGRVHVRILHLLRIKKSWFRFLDRSMVRGGVCFSIIYSL